MHTNWIYRKKQNLNIFLIFCQKKIKIPYLILYIDINVIHIEGLYCELLTAGTNLSHTLVWVSIR